MRGERWAALVTAIDGRRGVAEVAETAGLAAFEVEHALATLAGQGLLGVAGSERDAAPPTPTARVEKWPSALVPLGDVSALVAAVGTALGDMGGHEDWSLVLVEDHLAPALAAWDEAARATGRPWLPAAVVGGALWLGPLLGSGAPSCYICLARDLARCLPVLALWHRLGGRSLESDAAPPWLAAAAAERLATALGDPAAPWRERLLSIDLASGAARAHATRRYAACALCGEPTLTGASPPEPLLLEARPIASAVGGWRSVEPAHVRRRLEPFVSPLTGWVRDVRQWPLAPGLPCAIAVATYPHPEPLERFEDLGRRPGVAAAGKGWTAAQAEVGALAEAIERSSGVFRGDEPRRLASQRELDEEAVPPNAVQLFSPRQLAAASVDGDGRHRPAAAFDPGEPIEWTALWSLTAACRRFLPTTLCYHAYRGPGPRCPADSNGCAAGSNPEEAILQGLLELVERDHVAIWWHHRLRRPPFPVSGGLEATLDRAAEVHGNAGRDLRLLDLTADLGVPVAAAVSVPRGRGDVLLGFGAHLDPELAASRALAELHQFWPAEGALPRRRARAGSWLAPDAAAPRAPMHPPRAITDLREAILGIVARLGERGIEVLLLDQTRDGSPLAVVRVVAPGLRPWWRRLAPGRLYDVPVALGWLAAARSEDELNPDLLEV